MFCVCRSAFVLRFLLFSFSITLTITVWVSVRDLEIGGKWIFFFFLCLTNGVNEKHDRDLLTRSIFHRPYIQEDTYISATFIQQPLLRDTTLLYENNTSEIGFLLRRLRSFLQHKPMRLQWEVYNKTIKQRDVFGGSEKKKKALQQSSVLWVKTACFEDFVLLSS